MKLSQRHPLSAHANTFHSYHAIVYKSICAACYRKHQMHKTKTDHSKIVYEPFLSWSSKVKATISQDKFNSHFDYFNIVAKYAKAHVHNWLFGINRKLIVLKKMCHKIFLCAETSIETLSKTKVVIIFNRQSIILALLCNNRCFFYLYLKGFRF